MILALVSSRLFSESAGFPFPANNSIALLYSNSIRNMDDDEPSCESVPFKL